MKSRVKIFSYIVLLANIVLLAHSFVPHNHIGEASFSTINISESGCGCSSCIYHEVISMPNDCGPTCGCCSSGGNGCFILGGYLSQHSHDVVDVVSFIIAPTVINFAPTVEVTSASYAELVVSLPCSVLLSGIGMRAPPVLFS